MASPVQVGEEVVVTKAISQTERQLLGRHFRIVRFAKPHGYAVVEDKHGRWHVHPEALERAAP